ncbi:regulator of epidermal growth factor receptor (nucleomorph) [Cryptomonas paramecium]|uniref:Regulator of epidermal growth factor receptor n=1 Tax=Cryptomonas paramaecium TaxID=2898 RepID=F2HIA3_9CRYP|nr:regulator of epidermal growth factor receptor [Cryptomonas paramecium]AEA39027.1 regulator of epidermal growth factor receptor [Cryptomonas paramecium]|mmetsp:Transcript_46674/g.123869  ORF Transcript_46674/g.123869 Transcript_46674/m.123869 type:complete len:447 (+) Transcript_46674:183-1523(+)
MFFYNKEELNFLIFSYFQECGYFHSSFVFGQECNLNYLKYKNFFIPPGSLVSIFRRGLFYFEIENNFIQLFRKNLHVFNFLINKKTTLNQICYKKFTKTKIVAFLNNNLINSCVWHPRKMAAYIDTNNSKIYIWRILNENKKSLLKISDSCFFDSKNKPGTKQNKITMIDVNLSGTIFVSVSRFNLISFWAETGKKIKSTNIVNFYIDIIKWNENSSHIITGCFKCKFAIFSCWNFKILLYVYFYNFDFLTINWFNKKILLSFINEFTIIFANLSKKYFKEVFAHNSKICNADIYFVNNLICSGSKRGKIYTWLYHEKKMNLISKINAHFKQIIDLKWKPFILNHNLVIRTLILSTSLDYFIKIWDVYNQSCIFCVNQAKQTISAAWNPYKNKILIGTYQNFIFIDYEKNVFLCIKRRSNLFELLSHHIFKFFLLASCNKLYCWYA